MYRLAVVTLLFASCAIRIPSAPMAAQDGDVLLRNEPFSVAIVSDFAAGGDALADALAAAKPDLLVLAGNAIDRSRTDDWIALFDAVGGIPVVPLPGDGERRGDRSLDRFLASWQGLGVDGLPDPVSWRAFVVSTPSRRWRFVVLDADRANLDGGWNNQLHWIPKAATAGDEPLVVLLAHPPRSLTAGRDAAAEELVALLREHADPPRVVLVASGGAAAPELVLPGGRWGEAWLAAGPPAPPVGPLPRSADDLVLAPPADAALTGWFAGALDDAGRQALAAAPAYDERWPVAGFWWLTFTEGAIGCELRLFHDGTWVPLPLVRWSADSGWTAIDAENEAASVGP